MKRMAFVVLGLLAVALVVLNLEGKITGKAVESPYKPASPYTCKDSDGGRNPEVQGTVTNILGSFPDTCKNERTLFEHTCKGNVHRKETVPCPVRCRDGACASY